MNRRKFLVASACLAAMPWTGEAVAVGSRLSKKRRFTFKPYRGSKTLAPIQRVTPDDGFYVHT